MVRGEGAREHPQVPAPDPREVLTGARFFTTWTPDGDDPAAVMRGPFATALGAWPARVVGAVSEVSSRGGMGIDSC
jgi:hypothetical protein